jgi:four helix bundle protein
VKWDPFAKETVARQLVRAADNQRFVRMARGSLYEVRHFLRRADQRCLIARPEKQPLQALLHELLPALNAYLRSLGTEKKIDLAKNHDRG